MLTEMVSDAVISDDARYRYSLTRRWDDGGGLVNFVMLNPSTADASADDPTIRRCVGFAKSWGFDALVVTNLYAYRATDPADLWKAYAHSRLGPLNNEFIFKYACVSDLVVCAWGAHGKRDGRARVVRKLIADAGAVPHAIRLTKDGQPCHPLYLPANLSPVRFP